jgi:hypothetical protein
VLIKATFISSLIISGFTILNLTSTHGILNVISKFIFNNNATFISSLNIFGFAIVNSTRLFLL